MKLKECPVITTLSVMGGKWKPVILWELREETRRFTEIKREVEGITNKMLTQQLRELEADQIIRRKVYSNEMPLRVEYSLTDYGRTLVPILQAMCKWGIAHQKGEHDKLLSAV